MKNVLTLILALFLAVPVFSQQIAAGEERVTMDYNPDFLFKDITSTDPEEIKSRKLIILDNLKTDPAEQFADQYLEKRRLEAIDRLRKKVLEG